MSHRRTVSNGDGTGSDVSWCDWSKVEMKGFDDCITGLLGLWALYIFWGSKKCKRTQCFRNWMFLFSGEGVGDTYSVGSIRKS
jgi:hypothetical protein